MDFMDRYYDPSAGYLFNLNTALLHETRSSSWYAAGLLARNQNDDVDQAVRIINNIIAPQFTDPRDQWYGDYQVYPEQPTPGVPSYEAVIYNSWDPNWRGFIGTAFIVILEEFSDLLPLELQDRMVKSLHLDALGDTYRVGGVDDDNLYPSYSNAALMHTVLSAWVGRRTGDKNLTAEGEAYAKEIVELFNMNQTLSEFNSPTYLGVSLFALTLWAKYLPEDSVLGENGGRMMSSIWESVGQLYNANLKNLAGPFDRAYGYDMNRYISILGLWIWSLVGLDDAPVYRKPWASAHVDDFEIGALVSILSGFHKNFVSESVLQALMTYAGGERLVHHSAYSPAYDFKQRNMSSWISPNLTIGAESFDENVVGGPNINPAQFNPAVVQWIRKDSQIGFITLYPEVQAMHAEVQAGKLNLTYPNGNATSRFTFHVSPNGVHGEKDVKSWEDIQGVTVKVTGNIDPTPTVAFCGIAGGVCDPVNDFDLWNITYYVPAGSAEAPNIVLEISSD